jgi:tetratricopeptide (TPR) repeat protein
LLAKARSRLSLGDVEGAVADHREAIRLYPESAALHAALGNTLASAGDIETAVDCQRTAISLNAQCAPAYAGLLTTLRGRAGDQERDAAIALLDAPWMTDMRRSGLRFGLAAYYDGREDWDEAAQQMVEANALRKTAEARRVCDKMPDNYALLGWLAVLFPRARFIYCRRDPRDIALSCWVTNFAQIRWANDLDHLAHRLQQHNRLMAHWRRVLPISFLELDYEAMVADQESQSRRLIDWLGLDWDQRCLSFYKTERLVRTASVTQVRQPIYTRSIARWRHYDKMLAPLLTALDKS